MAARQMVDWQDETQDSREFLKDLKVDLAPTEVFVFTPKGEVMSLRAGIQRRSISPTPSTPRWATIAWARR